MRYFNATLLRKIKIGEDRLGNSEYNYEDIEIKNCRATEWNSNDVNVLGRDLTDTHRKVLIPPVEVEFDDIEYIRIDNTRYKITNIKDLGRWVLLIVGGYRI